MSLKLRTQSYEGAAAPPESLDATRRPDGENFRMRISRLGELSTETEVTFALDAAASSSSMPPSSTVAIAYQWHAPPFEGLHGAPMEVLTQSQSSFLPRTSLLLADDSIPHSPPAVSSTSITNGGEALRGLAAAFQSRRDPAELLGGVSNNSAHVSQAATTRVAVSPGSSPGRVSPSAHWMHNVSFAVGGSPAVGGANEFLTPARRFSSEGDIGFGSPPEAPLTHEEPAVAPFAVPRHATDSTTAPMSSAYAEPQSDAADPPHDRRRSSDPSSGAAKYTVASGEELLKHNHRVNTHVVIGQLHQNACEGITDVRERTKSALCAVRLLRIPAPRHASAVRLLDQAAPLVEGRLTALLKSMQHTQPPMVVDDAASTVAVGAGGQQGRDKRKLSVTMDRTLSASDPLPRLSDTVSKAASISDGGLIPISAQLSDLEHSDNGSELPLFQRVVSGVALRRLRDASEGGSRGASPESLSESRNTHGHCSLPVIRVEAEFARHSVDEEQPELRVAVAHPLITRGNLLDRFTEWLHTHRPNAVEREVVIRAILRVLLKQLQRLHANGDVHGSVKATNVFVWSDIPPDDQPQQPSSSAQAQNRQQPASATDSDVSTVPLKHAMFQPSDMTQSSTAKSRTVSFGANDRQPTLTPVITPDRLSSLFPGVNMTPSVIAAAPWVSELVLVDGYYHSIESTIRDVLLQVRGTSPAAEGGSDDVISTWIKSLRSSSSFADDTTLAWFPVAAAEYVEPPEIREHDGSSRNATPIPTVNVAHDLWNLGLLAIQLADGGFPSWLRRQRRPVPSLSKRHWSHKFSSFIQVCVALDPTQRSSATELLQDPWFRSIIHRPATSQLTAGSSNACNNIAHLPSSSSSSSQLPAAPSAAEAADDASAAPSYGSHPLDRNRVTQHLVQHTAEAGRVFLPQKNYLRSLPDMRLGFLQLVANVRRRVFLSTAAPGSHQHVSSQAAPGAPSASCGITTDILQAEAEAPLQGMSTDGVPPALQRLGPDTVAEPSEDSSSIVMLAAFLSAMEKVRRETLHGLGYAVGPTSVTAVSFETDGEFSGADVNEVVVCAADGMALSAEQLREVQLVDDRLSHVVQCVLDVHALSPTFAEHWMVSLLQRMAATDPPPQDFAGEGDDQWMTASLRKAVLPQPHDGMSLTVQSRRRGFLSIDPAPAMSVPVHASSILPVSAATVTPSGLMPQQMKRPVTSSLSPQLPPSRGVALGHDDPPQQQQASSLLQHRDMSGDANPQNHSNGNPAPPPQHPSPSQCHDFLMYKWLTLATLTVQERR